MDLEPKLVHMGHHITPRIIMRRTTSFNVHPSTMQNAAKYSVTVERPRQ